MVEVVLKDTDIAGGGNHLLSKCVNWAVTDNLRAIKVETWKLINANVMASNGAVFGLTELFWLVVRSGLSEPNKRKNKDRKCRIDIGQTILE
jgi:hypothetical protein